MIDQHALLITIALMAAIVYLTRLGGYLLGLSIRNIPGITPILKTLPGCAFMAILAPAVRQGNASEILAMLLVVILMWVTDNVALASIVGVAVLLFAQPYLEQIAIFNR